MARLELHRTLWSPLPWLGMALFWLLAKPVVDRGSVGRVEVTTEFGVAAFLCHTTFLLHVFLVGALGTTIARDEEFGLQDLLHGTPLSAGEYVGGKFLGLLGVMVLVLCFQGLSFFLSLVASEPEEVPQLLELVRPVLWFSLPLILFLLGLTLAVGEWTLKPAAVLVAPAFLVVACSAFLWTWTPPGLDPAWDRLLMALDPSGYRWLERNWLEVDRGNQFYREHWIPLSRDFVASRLAFAGSGLLFLVGAARHLRRRVRGLGRAGSGVVEQRGAGFLGGEEAREAILPRGPVAETLEIARVELGCLARQPSVLVLGGLVLLGALTSLLALTGPFDAPLLLTPGMAAVGLHTVLTTTLVPLSTFFVVESLRRDRVLKAAELILATRVRTLSVLLGKLLANVLLCAAFLLLLLAGCMAMIALQGEVALDVRPFLGTWGVLLLPTIAFWIVLVAFVFGMTRSRPATWGLCLALWVWLLFLLGFGGPDRWWRNWTLLGIVRWSDMGSFELEALPLWVNRLGLLAIGSILFLLALRAFPRRDGNARRRLQGTLAGIALAAGLGAGDHVLGEREDERFSAESGDDPACALDLSGVDLDLRLEPDRHWFRSRGRYRLVNRTGSSVEEFVLYRNPRWESTSWQLDGVLCEPPADGRKVTFDLPAVLAPDAEVEVGFEASGRVPDSLMILFGYEFEFILPSGIVLTNTTPTFVPTLTTGETTRVYRDPEENEDDARFTEPGFGARVAFHVRTRIDAPEEYLVNGVGTLVKDQVSAGRRVREFETRYPVKAFNLVGGRYAVRAGPGSALYFHPGHEHNLDEMQEALEGALRHYSEWFHPYPWGELRINEFPGLVDYAQGFPTNVPFSESMGFLVRKDPRMPLAFLVTAHECAHQWWGNLVVPGEGRGGEVLSEGLAHFSTLLLVEELRGDSDRKELCKRFEEGYLAARSPDWEPALVNLGLWDQLAYDKGAWAFWMLLQHMGREPLLEGLQRFVERYRQNPDHPLLEDLLGMLREQAEDTAAFDAFVEQWFRLVVLPEYQILDVAVEHDAARGSWRVSATVRNAGTGSMPVTVAVLGSGRPGDAAGVPEVRGELELGGGESVPLVLDCDFEPALLVVDPDVLVLQARRSTARAEL